MIPTTLLLGAVVYATLGGFGLVPTPWWVIVLVLVVGGIAGGWINAPIWRRE